MSEQKESAYITKCQGKTPVYLLAEDYLMYRGFKPDEIERFGFGYDPNHKIPWYDEEGREHRERIIIPWKGTSHYHIDRALHDDPRGAKYSKPSAKIVGNQPLYNPAALDKPLFFIVEGVFDALAVEACGFEAIAVGGSGLNGENFETVVTHGVMGCAVVMLDNDTTGKRNQQPLVDSLNDEGVRAFGCTIDGYKDAGEWFARDRDGFRAFLTSIVDNCHTHYQNEQNSRLDRSLATLNVKNPLDIALNLATMDGYQEPIPTGFRLLDDALSGGLRPGLHILGALSSLGKTTMTIQIADHMAELGKPVLFVSVEQSVNEIVAKSLSRYVHQLSNGKTKISTLEIMGDHSKWYEPEKRNAMFMRACTAYTEQVAPNMRIMEGIRQPSVDDIGKAARLIQSKRGESPVIFIDYLQLLAPMNERDTDKQATDKNVMALRQLSRDLRTPVFVISSLNRSSYSEGVTMEAFKESGAIEYSSDTLLGLQPIGLTKTLDETTKDKIKRAANKVVREHKGALDRECEVLILKNRNGLTPIDGIPLQFKPASSLFTEATKPTVSLYSDMPSLDDYRRR